MAYSRQASRQTLKTRARMLANVRAFFAAHDVLEVETPALSTAAVSDPALDSVVATLSNLPEHYLHTSPEFAMKRLLASGIGDCYQICRVFRDGELGRWHQPEFTLLEWYRVGWDELALMTEVEALIDAALEPLMLAKPSTQVIYDEAFRIALGISSYAASDELHRCLASHAVHVPDDLDHDGLLDLAMSSTVVPKLEPDRLTFVRDYPASQAALAVIKPQSPPVAARFEVFAHGLELGNGFYELTDAGEQRARFEQELRSRAAAGRVTRPLDQEFLEALRDLPACAGVAIGVDRLVALATGSGRLAETMAFAHDELSP